MGASEPFIQHVPLNQIELGPSELVFQIHDPDRAGTVIARLIPDRGQRVTTSLSAYRTERETYQASYRAHADRADADQQ